ncbi:heavy metal translocating P-type ATPase [Jannaschia pohangensis]|uniref:Cu2+-exporting ATPase n=1 Tax=Jannaschia pohangensis TaxID=390807 RepID=A0A1I3SFZ9_9RHOB|nr:heavy metal translocating P-type ATPase [Jannaschia pohangensis]SFJ57698.1 Cu2+-exporting ATPase [Jannaschia pohangensis]
MSAVAACPGCIAAPDERPALHAAAGADLVLSLPGIHCAGCIGGVERALTALPGVRSARVNLSRKRVSIVTDPGLGAEMPIRALAEAGYEAAELDAALLDTPDPKARALLARIAVAGFAMMNVMALSVAVWSGASAVTQDMFHWLSAAIALPAVTYAAQPFAVGAWTALRAGRMNMDVPIAVAIALACGSSLYETAFGGGTAWFDAALSLTFFLLIGRWLDHRARGRARSAAADLTALEMTRATVRRDGADIVVPVAALEVGDVVILHPGSRAPVDGIALDAATLDRAALTGESLPVPIDPEATVCAGEVVLGQPLRLRATARAEDSTLRRLAALLDVAETGRHRYSSLADRAAALYAPLVHLLAAAAFVGWWWHSGSAHTALGVATAVLIITCPCALGLAVPTVTTTVSGRLFKAGVLLKSGTALERLAEVDTVLLDKTGTLTTGRADLSGLDPAAAGIAAALARASAHPVSRAIAAALEGVAAAEVTDLREEPGQGITGQTVDGPVALTRGADGPVLVLPTGARPLTFAETLRPGAAEMIGALRARGFAVHMVTGDTAERAARIADQLGIAEVHAAASPTDKADLIDRLTAQGHKVLMLGDGLNDTTALARAHASLSPASALDAARAASDAVLLGDGLARVPLALAEARLAARRIRQNFGLAIAYNLVAVPLALLGLATPLIAAVAMSSSSVTVVLNALRRGRA